MHSVTTRIMWKNIINADIEHRGPNGDNDKLFQWGRKSRENEDANKGHTLETRSEMEGLSSDSSASTFVYKTQL